MKRTYFILFLLIPVIILLSACQKEIEFDHDLIKPKLVINGFIAPDSMVNITVGLSKPIPGFDKPFEWVDDAKATLYVNGEKAEELRVYTIDYEENKDENNYWYNNSPVKPTCVYQSHSTVIEAGNTYKIEVSHPTHGTAIGETSIPNPVEIISVNSVTTKIDEQYNDYHFQQIVLGLKVRFKDLPNEKNYYRITMERKVGISSKFQYHYFSGDEKPDEDEDYILINNSYNAGTIYSNDPILAGDEDANDFLFSSPRNRYNVFTDDLIEGKEYELNIEAWYKDNIKNETRFLSEPGEFYQINVTLSSLTREAFLYMKSTNAQQSYGEDLFSEPTQAFSNIENGVGIFAGYSVASKFISEGQYPIDSIHYEEIENYYY